MRRWARLLVSSAGLAGLAALATIGIADAAVIRGTGGAPSDPLLTGGQVVDFEAARPDRSPGRTVDHVTFTAGAGTKVQIGSDYAGRYNTRGSLSLYNSYAQDSFQTLHIEFSKAVRAVAFNFGASDENWQLTALDGAGLVLRSFTIGPVEASNAGDYFGIKAAGIRSLDLVQDRSRTSSIDYVFLDDLTFVTPLPPAALLLASALGLGGLWRGRSRRDQVARTA